MSILHLAVLLTLSLLSHSQDIPTPISDFDAADLLASWQVLGIFDPNSSLNLQHSFCPTATFTSDSDSEITFSLRIKVGFQLSVDYSNITYTINPENQAILETSDPDSNLVVVGYSSNVVILVQEDMNLGFILSQDGNLWSQNVSVLLDNLPQNEWKNFQQDFHGYFQASCNPPYPILASPSNTLGSYYTAALYLPKESESVISSYECSSIYFKDMRSYWKIFFGVSQQYLPNEYLVGFKDPDNLALIRSDENVWGVAYLDSEYLVLLQGFIKGSITATLYSTKTEIPSSAYDLFAEIIAAEGIERSDFKIWTIDNSECQSRNSQQIISL